MLACKQGLDRFGKEIMAARNPFLNERAAQRQPPTLAAVFANASQPDSPGVPSQEQPFHGCALARSYCQGLG